MKDYLDDFQRHFDLLKFILEGFDEFGIPRDSARIC